MFKTTFIAWFMPGNHAFYDRPFGFNCSICVSSVSQPSTPSQHKNKYTVILLILIPFTPHRCIKLCAQSDDDAILSAQCERFKSLTLDDIGLERQLQSASSQPFLSSIRLLQVSLLCASFSKSAPPPPPSSILMHFLCVGYCVSDVASFETRAHS